VGVNRFVMDSEDSYQPSQADPQLEAEQCKRLEALRRDRNTSAVSGALSALRRAAEGTENVLVSMKAALALSQPRAKCRLLCGMCGAAMRLRTSSRSRTLLPIGPRGRPMTMSCSHADPLRHAIPVKVG
jgi:hypothetical protein